MPEYICMVIIFTQPLCLPSHLMGMFYRTIRMLESGIKPVYVFDGKPPQLKSGEVRQKHLRIFSVEIRSDLDLETGFIKSQLK